MSDARRRSRVDPRGRRGAFLGDAQAVAEDAVSLDSRLGVGGGRPRDGSAGAVEDRAPRTGPPLRRLALGVTAFCALFVAVIAPSLLTAREPVSLAERMAGEGLLRGRNALVSAGGLVLALALILNGGNALGRATAPRPRRLSRVGAYLVWAAAAAMMRYWFDHAR